MSDEKDLLVKNDNPQSDGSANSALSVETQNGTATGSVGDFNAAENDRQKKLILPFANEKVSETEDENVLVDAKCVSMKFRLLTEKIDNIKEYFIKFLKRKIKYEDFWAVKDVSLKVYRGESVALIGRNGAGKSTLLRLISGILEPTEGRIFTRGNMVPLLKLGAGFDMDASGKENVYLNGAMLGFTKKEMDKKYDSIVAFSELEKFMSVPLKNYSAGMLARLGFSIAVDVNPDILLVDEILSVGDAPFRQKCVDKIAELKKSGVTFIVVSHSMQSVKDLCEKAVWLKDGRVFMEGDVNEVADAYTLDCKQNP